MKKRESIVPNYRPIWKTALPDRMCRIYGDTMPKKAAPVVGLRLKLPPEKKDHIAPERFLEDNSIETLYESGEYILCRQCRQLITAAAERITVQGSHQHTFANPHGIVHQIGCFRNAKGCSYTGALTSEWSWFKGSDWRIAVCSICRVHLGWLFVAAGTEQFNGLILNRLYFGEEKNR